jgi:tetratricopeptide (TPR) repeat protein
LRRAILILLASIGVNLGAAIAVGAHAAPQISGFDAAVLQDAAVLLREKRASDALAKLAPLATNLKDNAEFETLYGVALTDTGHPREGITALRRALAAEPDNFAAHAQLGRALAAAGEFSAAREEIAALRDRPDLPPGMHEVMVRNLEAIDGALKRKERAEKRQKLAQAAAPAGPRASDSDRATIRTAAELVRAKKAAKALAKLDPLADRLAGNPDFDYVYGVAALEAGHPAQASVALRRAIAARPDFHLARAELGRALAAMGDLAGAKREFETVRDVAGLPAMARDAMGREVLAIDQALTQSGIAPGQPGPARPEKPQPRTVISGYIENSIGYDTNVNAGPSSETLLIPALSFLGPASIAPQAMPKKSGFYELAGGLTVTHALDNDTALFANVVGNWHPLFDHGEFRTALAGGEAGIARRFGELGTVSLAAVGQTFMEGDSAFRNIYGAAAQWRQRYADTWDVSLSASWLGIEYPTQVGQNTDRYSAIGTIARRWEQLPLAPAISVTATAGKEIARSAGMDFLSFTLFGGRMGLETTWAPWLVAFAQVSYEDHDYDADYPLFFRHRHDVLLDALGGVEIKLSERVSLRPSVHYSETRSNIDLFDQKRWITAVAVRTTF